MNLICYIAVLEYIVKFPDNYLRIVQKLANQKKLAVVFSDKELVFGVSMPFPDFVILNDDSLIQWNIIKWQEEQVEEV